MIHEDKVSVDDVEFTLKELKNNDIYDQMYHPSLLYSENMEIGMHSNVFGESPFHLIYIENELICVHPHPVTII